MKTLRWIVLAAVVAGCEGNVNNGDVLLAWTSAVTTDAAGSFVANGGGTVSLSGDGRWAVFSSSSSALAPGDGDISEDVFLKDLSTGAITRISVDSLGGETASFCSEPSLSGNGRFVAFSSSDGTLVPGDSNAAQDIFVRDLAAGTTELVSVDTGGGLANGDSSRPSISADGRFVAFYSTATDLHADDADATNDVFVRDRQLDVTLLVSRATGPAGAKSASASMNPVISADGRRVSFVCFATLDAADTNGSTDIYVRDITTDQTILVSRADGMAGAVSSSGTNSISGINADGTVVAFSSGSTNLVAVDLNSAVDVFVRNLALGTTVMASLNSKGQQTALSGGGASSPNSEFPAISSDGVLVAFWSSGQNLVDGDTNGRYDVFVKDLSTGAVVRANVRTGGVETLGDIDLMSQDRMKPSFSADGRFVGFGTGAANLGVNDLNASLDCFVRGPLR